MLFSLAALLVPIWVFVMVSYDWLWLAPLPLLVLVVVRLANKQLSSAQRGFAALTLLMLLLALLAGQTELALLYYPVWINAGLLLLFGWSLFFPPTMIERFARLMEGDLPPKAIVYTRKVTQVWCLFFIGNGTIAFWLAWVGNWQWWAWYNGGIAYGLMGLLLGIEWLVRQQVKKHD
ncbi:hypothetical protein A5320_16815 [Rheinheimera sp. SA_1]|uniref:COG4648 family protein n=1 Tax=Rheinheimera sp. SA_1 TaxID=1827365 RepID=UPI000801F80C|nr:hypothetical protein [Rheinheimera sp. SA_1]OBP13827.1 hypothetical protein A5320_16815 [Rheinheimera sp. SA_1]